MIFFLIGSTVNLAMIWSARLWRIVMLVLAYHGMLALAFVRPGLITRGIGTGQGYLVPGPSLAALLALLAIEAAAMAAIRLDSVAGLAQAERAVKTAIACFGGFVFECVLAVAVMVWLNMGMF